MPVHQANKSHGFSLMRVSIKKNIYLNLIALTAIFFAGVSQPDLPALAAGPSSAAGAPATASKTLKGSVNQNEITDRLESFGIKSVIHVVGVKNTIYVDTVRPGSKAFYKGVEPGDVVRGLVQKDDNTFYLNIERKGVPYQIILTGAADLNRLGGVKRTATLDTSASDTNLSADLKNSPETRAKSLLKYEIELLIDVSGSMEQEDGTDGQSKFAWCHDQVMALAQKLGPYRKQLTITSFNNSSATEESCSVERVEQVFAATRPSGGTDLLHPLQAAMIRGESRTRGSGQRSMIVVITDGLPNIPADPKAINQMIVDFTQRLKSPDQMILVFFQIGNTFNGKQFCKTLDDDLLSQGARYDIVDTQTFDQLKATGLTNALVNAIVEEKLLANHRHDQKPLADMSSNTELQRLKKERAQIEKELMGN
jgi:hypothetical protein